MYDDNWTKSGFNYIIKASEKILDYMNSIDSTNINKLDIYADIAWINFMAIKMKERGVK